MWKGGAPCLQLICALSWQLRVLCSKEMEVLHVLSSVTLHCVLVTAEVLPLRRNGGPPCSILSYSMLCPCERWGPCSHEEWTCSLSSAILCFVLVTIEFLVFMSNGGAIYPKLFCGVYWWHLRALCSWGMEVFPVFIWSVLCHGDSCRPSAHDERWHSLSSPALCYFLVTLEVPALMRNGDAPYSWLSHAVPLWYWGPYALEEWKSLPVFVSL